MPKPQHILVYLVLLLLSAGSLRAQNNQFNIGGGSGQLKITIYTTGNFYVERESFPGSAVWQRQFYMSSTPLFAIKIGATVYSSNALSTYTIGGDVVNTVGTRGEYSKTFSRTHNGQPFSVTIKVIYDTSNPDYFVLEATLDTRSITSGEPISLAYGYDSYVNDCDGGAAWILPDPNGYNGVNASRNLTTAEVQNLRFAGGINNRGIGSIMGFFPIGRPFDQAYSAFYTSAYANKVISNSYNNLFKFGPPAVPSCGGGQPWDNGVGVVYDNIPSGVKTTISTGLTFSDVIDGMLDYTWDGVKNKTVSIGDIVTLNLAYTSISTSTLTGIAFRANFPGLDVDAACSTAGWISGTSACTVGSSYYKLSNASIVAAGVGTVDVPIEVQQYGQWVVSASSISETVKTLPTGTPATLMASTSVNISNVSVTNICTGNSSTITLKLDGAVSTSQPITVTIDYTGSTATAADYSQRPTSLVIPAGANSASFTIITTPTAVSGRTFNIRLASTDKAFATIGANATTVVSIGTPALTSQTLVNLCTGAPLSYTATSSATGATFSWTRAAVSGISNAAASGSSANISETLVNTTTSPIDVSYAITMTANGCGGVRNVTVKVNPIPSLSSTLNPTGICSGSPFAYAATSTSAGVTFSWTRAAVAGISNAAANGSTANISETLVNTTDNPIDVSYVFTLATSGCSNTQNVVVKVNPTPALSSTLSPTAVCSGTTFSYTATSAVAGTSFSWTRNAITGISNAAASGSTANISEQLINTTNAPIAVTYNITLTKGTCTTTHNVVVTVKPSPTLVGTLNPAAICSGTPFSCIPSCSVSGASYTWTRAVVSGISNPVGSGVNSLIDETLINTTTTAIPVPYIVTLAANGCTAQQTVTATVNPMPTLSFSASIGNVCYNTSPIVSLSGLNSSDTYNIYSSTTKEKLASIHGVAAKQADLGVTLKENASYQIQAISDLGCTSKDMMTVNANMVKLEFQTIDLPRYKTGEQYSQQLISNAVHPQYYIAGGSLPMGITMNGDGVIAGLVPRGKGSNIGHPVSIQVKDINGCIAEQPYNIKSELFIPEVFSPNNDGINDHFMKGYHVVIFDRLGVKLCESNDGWDGTCKGRVMPTDTYFYVLYHTTDAGKDVQATGYIMILKQ